jgi:hypothetical protein
MNDLDLLPNDIMKNVNKTVHDLYKIERKKLKENRKMNGDRNN